MNSLTRLFLPAAVLLACAAAPLSAADAVELKQRWMTGKKYFQTVQTTQSMTIDMEPQKIETKNSTTMEMSLAVRPREDGTRKRVTMKTERVAVNTETNGQKTAFDSAKPAEGTHPPGLMLAGTVGKELVVLLTATDDISEVENLDEYLKNFPQVPGMDMAKIVSKDYIAQTMKQGALLAMPGKPVQPGDSWPFTNVMELPQMGRIAVKGTYTFKGMAAHGGVPCAEIATIAEISPVPTWPTPNSPLGMKVEGGTVKGTIWFDPKLGFARDSQFTQEMNMTMQKPSDPTATLKLPVRQEISNTLTKVEDLK